MKNRINYFIEKDFKLKIYRFDLEIYHKTKRISFEIFLFILTTKFMAIDF